MIIHANYIFPCVKSVIVWNNIWGVQWIQDASYSGVIQAQIKKWKTYRVNYKRKGGAGSIK